LCRREGKRGIRLGKIDLDGLPSNVSVNTKIK
jgi:hypothetical protein